MNTKPSLAKRLSPRSMTRYQGWGWATVLASVSICVMVAWLHFRQIQLLNQTTDAITNMHLARIELAKGFLAVTLSKDPNAPFSREEGLALLQQASDSLENVAANLGMVSTIENLAEFRRDLEAFQASLTEFRATTNSTPAQETALRIAFHNLENHASEMDAQSHDKLDALKKRFDLQFAIVLGGSMILLAGISAALILAEQARKKADEALAESEDRYTILFQKSSIPVFVLKLPEVVIADANEAAEKLTGFRREEILGKTAAELGLISQDKRAETIAKFEKDKSLTDNEMQIVTKSGQERIIVVNTNPLQINGQPFAFTSMQDITERKQVEQELQESKERLALVLEGSQLGYWDWNIETGQVHRNARWAEMLGYTLEEIELNVRQWTDLHHPDDREAAWKSIQDHLDGKTPAHRIEYRMRTKDGEYKWILDQAKVVQRAPDGKPLRMSGTHTDITERKEAETALKRSETLLKEMGRIAQIGGWELDVATMKQVWTDETYLIHDRERDVYDPNSAEEISRFEPGSKERIEKAFDEAIRLGTPYDLEVEMTTVKGNRKWVRAVCSPVLLDGKVTKLAGTVQDITERKTMQLQLQENERNYRELVQNANSAILRWRSDGTIAFFNEFAQSFFGYRPEEVIGQPVGILVPPTDSTGGDLSTLVQNIVEHPEDFVNVVNENICRDGRRVWMAWTNKPVYDERGQISEILAVGVDITERKRMEDELLRSNAELEQFAYVASHDLQEPLRTVAGMMQLLQQRYQNRLDERADEYIHFAVDASERMQKLISDLLDFSRVERKGKPFARTDMEKVLQNALANLQVSIAESGASIAHDPLPTVQADAGQLTQVLQNLIGNAIKFRGEQPLEVYISAEKVEHGWQFGVRDNGIGIDPQYFERIFLIFQRLHTRSKYPGTGIGLALCKKIIERHGGKMWIQSELNHGATFYFTIPERS